MVDQGKQRARKLNKYREKHALYENTTKQRTRTKGVREESLDWILSDKARTGGNGYFLYQCRTCNKPFMTLPWLTQCEKCHMDKRTTIAKW